MPAAALFYKPTCGYCRKVLHFMEKNGIKIPLKNVNESSQIRQELITIAQTAQVPCLVVNGKPLHESDDIMEWLEKHWNKNDNA